MMLENDTFELLGYYPSKLKPKSRKQILAKCDKCGKIRTIQRRSYSLLCRSCSMLGRVPWNKGLKTSDEVKEKLSKSHIGIQAGENSPMYGRTGEKSSNWRGGISFDPYCLKFNENFKERVRDYFGRCCYLCSKNEIDNKERLSVHHVAYNKDTCCDNSKPLFVPLCHSCHTKTNHNREFWQEFFTASLEFLTDGECYIKNK